MKFTLSWLKDHLETDANAATIADTLTSIGLEVEEVSNPAAALAPFKVAKVLSAERHPQADKLHVLSVDAGDGPVQVVCGAPNARAGMLGVFGPPGAYVPGSDMTLKVAAIRGVNSDGVMRTLVARGLVEEAGTDPETGAVLYRTTDYFLERLGLRSLDELPELAPFLPDDIESLEEQRQ